MGMRILECGVRILECGVRIPEWGVCIPEWGVRILVALLKAQEKGESAEIKRVST